LLDSLLQENCNNIETMLNLSMIELRKQFLTKSFLPSSVIRQAVDRSNLLSDLNIFITETADLASQQATEADQRYQENKSLGPLDGVCIAVKDNFCTNGVKTSCGSKMLDNFVSPYNATVVQKCLDGGGIMMGKTNLDEFAMGSGTIDSHAGPTKNIWGSTIPYDIKDDNGRTLSEHIPRTDDWVVAGGSSGGSAVAVATGVSHIGLGSDTGGSVRIPGAWCGIVSLKPSYGRLSRHGLIPLVNSLDCPGLMTRTVPDMAVALDMLQGRDNMDSTSIDSDPLDLDIINTLSDESDDGFKLRVGIPQEFHCDGMTMEVTSAWSEVTSLLDNLGAKVIPVSLPHTHLAIPCYSVLNPCEVASNMSRYDGLQYGLRGNGASTEDMFADSRSRGFNEVVRGRILAGNYFLLKRHYDKYFKQALKIRRLIMNDYIEAWSKVDVLLTPVTLSPPPLFSEFSNVDNRTQTATQDFCTQPMNLAGVPALTLPVKLSSSNLPLSLQLVAPWRQDEKLLKIGALLERKLKFPKLEINDVKIQV